MKTRFWHLAALAVILATSTARAETADLNSNYDSAEAPAMPASVVASYASDVQPSESPPETVQGNPVEGSAVPEQVAVPDAVPATADGQPVCNTCGNCPSCCRCRKCGPYSEPCPRIAAYAFTGIDSFRGVTNGSYPGNDGALTGLNLGGALLEDAGIGWQVGGTYGIYNFNGTQSPGSHIDSNTQQGFLTMGFFRRANINRRLSWGIVHDWMFTNNFGAFGNSPTLAQFRGQVAWALSSNNEIGVWATVQDRRVTRASGALGTPVSYQAIDQGNLFWHHKYGAYGADSWFYFGIPLDSRLAVPANSAGFPVGGSGGSIGSFILGTNWLIPINDRLSGYMNGMYMRPSAAEGMNAAGAYAQAQAFWNVEFGVAYYPGRAARSQTVAGRQWMPYMPVANNSSFLVDSSKTE